MTGREVDRPLRELALAALEFDELPAGNSHARRGLRMGQAAGKAKGAKSIKHFVFPLMGELNKVCSSSSRADICLGQSINA